MAGEIMTSYYLLSHVLLSHAVKLATMSTTEPFDSCMAKNDYRLSLSGSRTMNQEPDLSV